MSFVPKRGDIIKVNFSPQAGHEQASWRPAIVVSPEDYNATSTVCLVCPITHKSKNWPFEVELTDETQTSGFVLTDHLKSIDLTARGAKYVEEAPIEVIDEVLARIYPLVA